jgi:glycine oxidase
MNASTVARPDVAVIGAGVIGLSIAWRVAGAGLSVEVLDPALAGPVPESGASWAAAGMLAPVTEVHYGEESLLALNRAAADRWPTVAAELNAASGADIGYRTTGTVSVARDGDDLAALEELATYQEKLGLAVERLRAREVRRLEPALSPRVRGGLLVGGDHSVDNRAFVLALREAAQRAGAVLRPQSVERLDAVDAGTVVVAAGADSSRLVRDLPVRPVKGQLLHLRGPAPLTSRTLRGVEVYLVPRADGRLVIGASVEERGFDRRVTAGAVHDLLRAARELLPDVDELELTGTVVGLRPGTPDNAPLIGALDEGVIVATGHYRNGILLAPLTGELVADLLVSGRTPALLAPFAPHRFEEGRSCT